MSNLGIRLALGAIAAISIGCGSPERSRPIPTAPTQCSHPGAQRCSGGHVQTCDSTSLVWSVLEPCPTGGRCVGAGAGTYACAPVDDGGTSPDRVPPVADGGPPGYLDVGVDAGDSGTTALRILSASFGTPDLTDQGSTRLMVEVANAQGSLGGTISLSNVQIEALVTTGPNTLVYDLAWSQLDPATLDFYLEEQRTFRVEVFDQAGGADWVDVTIRLHCDGVPFGAGCAGRCVSANTNDNCGGCGLRCDNRRWPGIACVAPGSCEALLIYHSGLHGQTGHDVCAQKQQSSTCVSAIVERELFMAANVPCTTSFEFDVSRQISATISSIECYCNLGLVPKPAGQTCLQVCGGAACNDTVIYIDALGAVPGGWVADNCSSPYRRGPDWGLVGAGNVATFYIADTEVQLVCASSAVP